MRRRRRRGRLPAEQRVPPARRLATRRCQRPLLISAPDGAKVARCAPGRRRYAGRDGYVRGVRTLSDRPDPDRPRLGAGRHAPFAARDAAERSTVRSSLVDRLAVSGKCPDAAKVHEHTESNRGNLAEARPASGVS
jgi:hypothetical protein